MSLPKQRSTTERVESAKVENKVYYPYKIKKRMFVPYKIYADFEAILENIKEKKGKGEKYQKHIPCSYSFTKVKYDGAAEPRREYEGKDAAKHFVLTIICE